MKSKTSQSNPGKWTFLNVVMVIVAVIGLNVIAANLFFRWDITEEKIYTLSEGTENIVEKIESPVTIKFFFSKSLEGIPLPFKHYGKRISELLNEYQSLNSDQIKVEIFDPKPDSDEEEWADKYGLTGADANYGDRFFMGLVVSQADKEVAIPFLKPDRERYLEYDITQSLLEVTKEKTHKIAILTDLPIMGKQPSQMEQMQGMRPTPKWAFVSELEKNYQVELLDSNSFEVASDISTLLVLHPKRLSEKNRYAIDQFTLKGGDLVVLVDPYMRTDPMAGQMMQFGQPPASNMEKLFAHWGIEYQPGSVLGDPMTATQVNAGQGQVIPFSVWQSLNTNAFNPDLVATSHMETMLLIESGGFKLTEASPFNITEVLKGSPQAGFIEHTSLRNPDPLAINAMIKPAAQPPVIAGILSGELKSLYEKRPEFKAEKKGEEEIPAPVFQNQHLSVSSGKATVFLMTDVDFINDYFAVDRVNFFGQQITQPKNDNLGFLLNMVDFLGGSEEMMQIRSRGKFSRPFDKILMLERAAQSKYMDAKLELDGKLKEVQSRLSELKVQEGSQQIVLSKDQIEKLNQFKEEERKTKSKLRNIRKLLRTDIENLQQVLTMINLFVMPIIVALLGWFMYSRRSRRLHKMD